MAALEAGGTLKQSKCSGRKQGDNTEDCIFSPAFPGTPAYPHGGACVFCIPERALEAAQDAKKKKHIVSALNKFKEKNNDVYERALGRLRAHLTTEQFKAAVTPKNCCVGAGDELCTRSSKGDGGPARATKGKLCSGCALEQQETEKAQLEVERHARLADACASLEASRVGQMLLEVDVAQYCLDSVRQKTMQDIFWELPQEFWEGLRAAGENGKWSPWQHRGVLDRLKNILQHWELVGAGAAAAAPRSPLAADAASARREALAAWPAPDAAATLMRGAALERVELRENAMTLARDIAAAVPENVARVVKDGDRYPWRRAHHYVGLCAAAMNADRSHEMDAHVIKTELARMLNQILNEYPDADALKSELRHLAKAQEAPRAPRSRLAQSIWSIVQAAKEEEARDRALREQRGAAAEEAEHAEELYRKKPAEMAEELKRRLAKKESAPRPWPPLRGSRLIRGDIRREEKRGRGKPGGSRKKALEGHESNSSDSSDSEEHGSESAVPFLEPTGASERPPKRQKSSEDQGSARGSAASSSKRAE